MKTLPLIALSLAGLSALCAAERKAGAPEVGKLDPAMGAASAAAANVDWHDVTQWGVEGRAWPEMERLRWFDRFPSTAQKTVTSAVWNLSRDSTGMMVRFKTDATAIHVHYKVVKAALGMPHMPATGVSGVDLYARDDAGKWRWVQVTRPATQEIKAEVIKEYFLNYRALNADFTVDLASGNVTPHQVDPVDALQHR